MLGVLQRLEPVIGNPFSQDGDEFSPTWKLSKRLNEKEDNFFLPWVKNHLELNLRYTIICARLAHDFARKESGVNPLSEDEREALTQQLVDALSLAELLTRIYTRLNVPREIERLKSEQEVYRTLLAMRGYHFPNTPKVYHFEPNLPLSKRMSDYLEILNWPHLITEALRRILTFTTPVIDYLGESFSQKVRSNTAVLNFPRLMVVRTRRILMTMRPFLEHLKNYSKFINVVDPFIGPLLNYLSWIFYFPRLAVNLFLLLKHVIPSRWLTDAEKKLNWETRLQTQIQRRWFELSNDAVWFVGGLLGCFLLVGGLSAAGMYLTIGLFFFDVVLASIRAYIELNRLDRLRVEYKEIALTVSNDQSDFEEIASYQTHLEQWHLYEQKRLGLSIASTIALFLGMLFAIPAFTNPIIPLIGACLIVTITLLTYLIGKWVDSQKPSNKVDGIVEEGKRRFSPLPSSSPSRSRSSMFYHSDDSNEEPGKSLSESLGQVSTNDEDLDDTYQQLGIL
ncbi:MAG: hypothetical protein H0U57_11350 [Tatlockia sp.]|nr:hypothetical protein [Tatlockia sp.]